MSDQNGFMDMAGATGGDGLPFSPHGLHVLAVDDDKLCLKVIAKMLQQCHYEGNHDLFCPIAQSYESMAHRRVFPLSPPECT
jgi:hypothetical protein